MEKYNKYKDSGIEWLGDIPEHWGIERVKNIFKNLDSKRIPLSGSERQKMSLNRYDYYGASGVIDKVDKYIFNDTLILIGEDGANLVTRSKPLAFIAQGKFWVNNHAHILKPKFDNNINYFVLALESLDYSIWISGSAQPKLTQDKLNNISIYLPPLKEQTQIANYLDAKTTAIDKKVNLLQQKIKHYKAYRKTVINETVTKGLDKTVKLKDSGIDWIGEIPEHWEVKRLKDYFILSKGVNSSKYNNDYVKDEANLGEYPVYSGQTENNGLMAMINSFEYNYNKKVMLVTTVGAKAMDLKIVQGKFTLSQNCALFISKKGIDTDFQYFYLTQLFREERKVIPTIMQPSLRIEDLKKYFVLLPPIKEQQQIANYLDTKTTTIDKIVKNIEAQIITLKELRKTLINEVVTGKVKVSA